MIGAPSKKETFFPFYLKDRPDFFFHLLLSSYQPSVYDRSYKPMLFYTLARSMSTEHGVCQLSVCAVSFYVSRICGFKVEDAT